MNLLFVCARNRRRSGGRRGRDGLGRGQPDAEQPLTAEAIAWADVVFVMERRHRARMTRGFGRHLRGKRGVCLGIPDDFALMDPELVRLLWERVPRSVPGLAAARPG